MDTKFKERPYLAGGAGVTIYELTYSINGEPCAEYSQSKAELLRKAKIYREYDARELNALAKYTTTRADSRMVLAILNKQPWARKQEIVKDYIENKR
jgi:hypothetical protein